MPDNSDVPFGNFIPFHDKFQSVPTGYSYTGFFDYFDASDRGYAAFVAVPTGYSYTGFAISGFQTLTQSGQTVEIDESLNILDSTTISLALFQNEPLNIVDATDINLSVSESDSLNIVDELEIDLDIFLEEPLDIIDEFDLQGPVVANDELNILDAFMIALDIYNDESLDVADDLIISVIPDDGFDEPLNIVDETFVDPSLMVITSDSLDVVDLLGLLIDVHINEPLGIVDECAIRRTANFSFSTEIQIAHQRNDSFSAELVLMKDDPFPVQSTTSLSNPFEPSAVIDGVTIFNNPATFKGASGSYISINDIGYGSCDFKQLNVSLNLGGGSFSALTYTVPLGALGTTVMVAGLPFLITYVGRVADPLVGLIHKTEGVFGTVPILNKQILLVLGTQELKNFAGLFPSTPVSSAPPDQWKNVSSAARAIAGAAALSMLWATTDAPLVDQFLETGMTVGDALRSLAARVGGIVTPTQSSYVVIDPAAGFGGWLPFLSNSCYFVDGAEGGTHLDVDGQQIVIPVNPVPGSGFAAQGASFVKSPILFPPAPPVHHLHTFRSVIPAGGPPVYIELPGDFKEGRIQIFLGDGMPSVPNAVTDVSQWFATGFPIVTDNDGVERIRISSTDFNAGLVDGQFTMNIGYLKDDAGVNAASAQAASEGIQRKRLLIQSEQEKLRYFRKESGTLSMKFFGSMPIPGNNTSFTYNGIPISGIVEAANLTYAPPGIATLSVQIAKYYKLSLANPRSKLDAFLATGNQP